LQRLLSASSTTSAPWVIAYCRNTTVTLVCSKYAQGILAWRNIQEHAASEYVPRRARSNFA
jgi:hypothetical protein